MQEEDHDGSDHVQDDHEGNDLFGHGRDPLQATDHHQAYQDHDDRAGHSGGDSEDIHHVA